MKLIVIIIALITISCSTSKQAVVAVEGHEKSTTIYQKKTMKENQTSMHELEHTEKIK